LDLVQSEIENLLKKLGERFRQRHVLSTFGADKTAEKTCFAPL
jgi:hypothetical protein